MKKNKFIILSAAAFLFLTAPVFAQNRVTDNARLLSGGEISELERHAAEIASNYNFDIVIVTETDIGGASTENYADDYFDKYFGGRDGCLFLQVTGTRDYWFSTSGLGVKVLNSSAFNKLESSVVKYLKRGDYAGAYNAYINSWEEFLALNAEGKSYNIFRAYSVQFFIGAWVVSLLIAFFAVFMMKLKMDNVHSKTEADGFIVPGSLVFTKKNDVFLYSTVSKTERASSTAASHAGSSGRRHGGGGGKY